ncbi:MAG: glutamate formimidoyltransferase [Candidatus Acidiferrales bacterium]|jgi:glutamate formiminotransferase
MERLIECVPNFSEGRDLAKIDAIAAAIRGVWLLDRHSDADHNRTVITLAGEPDAVAEAAIRSVGRAAQLIDLTHHSGVHPRLGATDVVPFVPLEGCTIFDCIEIAHRVGQEIWKRHRIPVYFYEAAALRPGHARLDKIRSGGFEALLETDFPRNPERAPDVGDPKMHPTAGAIAVGVRNFLIAFNINLATTDLSVAQRIARAVRTSSGGLPNLKAMGVALPSRGLTQVSMNLTDFEKTPLDLVFRAVEREAERSGCRIVGSEIVGLAPRKAIAMIGDFDLKLENSVIAKILEDRLAAARAT